jgi:hypothetical protein
MNDNGYADIFAAGENASDQINLEDYFATFRDEPIFHFVTTNNSQRNEPIREALSIAMGIDPSLCFDYMSRPKSLLGYRSTEHYERWDIVDSRHIMMSTIIFSSLGQTVGNVVEIGGGFGNWLRLNETIINYPKWTIIDLPFISRLQEWYLTQELADTTKLELIDVPHYPEWLARNEDIALVIGTHSLSEMAWPVFCNYFDNVVIRTEYFFYATHTLLPTTSLVQKKLEYIQKSFLCVVDIPSEDGTVKNILYRRILEGKEPIELV